MHELPAMRHIFRGTTLDVHHTILPPTARLKPDARLLIEASVEIPGLPGVRTLALEDLILHSASHLFHEGEPDNLLRDLTDLDLLLKHLGRTMPPGTPSLPGPNACSSPAPCASPCATRSACSTPRSRRASARMSATTA
jgi:hypothetical protein